MFLQIKMVFKVIICLLILSDTTIAQYPYKLTNNQNTTASLSSESTNIAPPDKPWLEMGGDFRWFFIRDDARKLDKNVIDHERIFHRYRLRLWQKITVSDQFRINSRLMTEPRYYCKPDREHQLSHEEAFFDRLNLEFSNVYNYPLSIKVGRQDIHLGDDLLVRRGTPNDGSRSNFFDALRLNYAFQNQKTKLDLIYIDNHANSSQWLHPVNDSDVLLSDQDDQGAVVYLSNMLLASMMTDAYVIYKHDHDRINSKGTEGETYTIGSSLTKHLNEHWQWRGEVAPQFGHKNGTAVNAFFANMKWCYDFKDQQKTKSHILYEYASGDKNPDRHFDRLWGRSPKWSNLYNFGIDSIDGRLFNSSNLHRLNLGFDTSPGKFQLKGNIHVLFADQRVSSKYKANISKSGKFRGNLLTLQLKYKVSKRITHEFTGEAFFPGSYYTDSRNDIASYIRYALYISW